MPSAPQRGSSPVGTPPVDPLLAKQMAHGACGQRMAFLSGEADCTE